MLAILEGGQGARRPLRALESILDNGARGGYDCPTATTTKGMIRMPLPLPMPAIYVLRGNCPGPNPACRHAARNGRRVHINMEWDAMRESLIPTTHHFETVEQGIEQLTREWNDAITIKTDDELYAARINRIAHRLPIGWLDPEMRGDRVMTLHFER